VTATSRSYRVLSTKNLTTSRKKGNLDDAGRSYQDALKVFRQIGDPMGEASVLFDIGIVLLRKEQETVGLRTD